jgi:hypothetical protein
MSIHAPIRAPDPYADATSQVNAWRGRCMTYFARAEHAVTEALLSLTPEDAAPSAPLLVGERYAALYQALGTKPETEQIAVALSAFQVHDELRSFLCHGLSCVLLDRNGHWTATLELIAPARRKLERRTLIVSHADADGIATDLRVHDRIGARGPGRSERPPTRRGPRCSGRRGPVSSRRGAKRGPHG